MRHTKIISTPRSGQRLRRGGGSTTLIAVRSRRSCSRRVRLSRTSPRRQHGAAVSTLRAARADSSYLPPQTSRWRCCNPALRWGSWGSSPARPCRRASSGPLRRPGRRTRPQWPRVSRRGRPTGRSSPACGPAERLGGVLGQLHLGVPGAEDRFEYRGDVGGMLVLVSECCGSHSLRVGLPYDRRTDRDRHCRGTAVKRSSVKSFVDIGPGRRRLPGRWSCRVWTSVANVFNGTVAI